MKGRSRKADSESAPHARAQRVSREAGRAGGVSSEINCQRWAVLRWLYRDVGKMLSFLAADYPLPETMPARSWSVGSALSQLGFDRVHLGAEPPIGAAVHPVRPWWRSVDAGPSAMVSEARPQPRGLEVQEATRPLALRCVDQPAAAATGKPEIEAIELPNSLAALAEKPGPSTAERATRPCNSVLERRCAIVGMILHYPAIGAQAHEREIFCLLPERTEAVQFVHVEMVRSLNQPWHCQPPGRRDRAARGDRSIVAGSPACRACARRSC